MRTAEAWEPGSTGLVAFDTVKAQHDVQCQLGFRSLVRVQQVPVPVYGAQGTCEARSARTAVPVQAPHQLPIRPSIQASLAPARVSPLSHAGIGRVNGFPACGSRCLRTSIGE